MPDPSNKFHDLQNIIEDKFPNLHRKFHLGNKDEAVKEAMKLLTPVFQDAINDGFINSTEPIPIHSPPIPSQNFLDKIKQFFIFVRDAIRKFFTETLPKFFTQTIPNFFSWLVQKIKDMFN